MYFCSCVEWRSQCGKGTEERELVLEDVAKEPSKQLGYPSVKSRERSKGAHVDASVSSLQNH